MGPCGVAMRKIVGPHAVVLTPPRQNMTAHGVIEERRIDLVVEVFAGKFLDEQTLAVCAKSFEVVIPLLQDKWNPAKLILDQDNLELGETFEYAGIDQVIEAIDRLKQFHVDAVVLRGHAGCGIAEAEGTVSAITVAAQDVQVDRHLEILRGSPELVVMR